jgi:hypothetical protein
LTQLTLSQKGKNMIDPNKLQYFTMAAWMRGYAAGLDEYQHKALIYKLNKAADMLDFVWGNYAGEDDELKAGGTE